MVAVVSGVEVLVPAVSVLVVCGSSLASTPPTTAESADSRSWSSLPETTATNAIEATSATTTPTAISGARFHEREAG